MKSIPNYDPHLSSRSSSQKGSYNSIHPVGNPSKMSFGPTTPGIIPAPDYHPRNVGGPAPLPVKKDWLRRLTTKCVIVTVVTLIIAIVIMLYRIWPGCLISAALLLYALAGTVGCIAMQLPEVAEDMKGEMGEVRIFLLINQVVNLSIIWEAFWFAAGLVCMAFTWWAVLIAEFVNLFFLIMIAGGIMDEL